MHAIIKFTIFWLPFSYLKMQRLKYIPGVCNLFFVWATLKNMKLNAGQTEALVPSDINTIVSLAIIFNGLN
jgi:hypothetical protein